MTSEEFEIKAREWERKIEDIVIEMTQVAAENGLALVLTNHIPACEAFNALVDERRKALALANENLDKMMTGQKAPRAYCG